MGSNCNHRDYFMPLRGLTEKSSLLSPDPSFAAKTVVDGPDFLAVTSTNADDPLMPKGLLDRADFSPEFLELLAIIIKKDASAELTDSDLFRRLPAIEEAAHRLCYQYYAEFFTDNKLSAYHGIKDRLEKDLEKSILFLQLFTDGRYHASELQNALRSLMPEKYLPGEKTHCNNLSDSLNRLRAFCSRTWRVMNPLLSIFLTSTAAKEDIALATVVFLHLAWIFPVIRLSSAGHTIAKHTVGAQPHEESFNSLMRFAAQANRYRFLGPHDVVWGIVRLLGCVLWSTASTQVSLALFTFGFAESLVLRRLADEGNQRTVSALMEACDASPNKALLQFSLEAYNSGTVELYKNNGFKVRVMALYVAAFFATLCASLFLSKNQPSTQYSWSFYGNLVGGIAVVLTCLFQIVGAVSDKSLLPPVAKKVPKQAETSELRAVASESSVLSL